MTVPLLASLLANLTTSPAPTLSSPPPQGSVSGCGHARVPVHSVQSQPWTANE